MKINKVDLLVVDKSQASELNTDTPEKTIAELLDQKVDNLNEDNAGTTTEN